MKLERLPVELHPLAEAMAGLTAQPRSARGWTPYGYEDVAPPVPLIPDAPPDDGIYRGSWVSPGICLRIDLTHPAVDDDLRASLEGRFPEQIGKDHGFYEYGVECTSQRGNLEQALARLAQKVAAVRPPG
jgi:hypothetical protein